MKQKGDIFRAKAYQNASQTIKQITEPITSIEQLKGRLGIGQSILSKLDEYIKTGAIDIIEMEKQNPINVLVNVYGIGPKKAQELCSKGICTIQQLKENQQELNNVQKIGLKYYDDLLQRIPKQEINNFKLLLSNIFDKLLTKHSHLHGNFEIVGSFRRGAEDSGDIDIIITGNKVDIYTLFVNELIQMGILIEILSFGKVKTLSIGKLTTIARRLDFLYCPINEFPFALLYFTGSKDFNTNIRQYAINMGYTLNEHCICLFKNKIKGDKVLFYPKTEKDIFDFFELEYQVPQVRGIQTITKKKY